MFDVCWMGIPMATPMAIIPWLFLKLAYGYSYGYSWNIIRILTNDAFVTKYAQRP